MIESRHWRQIPKDELQRIVTEHDRLVVKNARLRSAFARFAQHDHDCPQSDLQADAECTCGLMSAIHGCGFGRMFDARNVAGGG